MSASLYYLNGIIVGGLYDVNIERHLSLVLYAVQYIKKLWSVLQFALQFSICVMHVGEVFCRKE